MRHPNKPISARRQMFNRRIPKDGTQIEAPLGSGAVPNVDSADAHD